MPKLQLPVAAARESNRRNEIRDAANRVRAHFAQKTVESIIPVYLTSFWPERMLVLWLSEKQSHRRASPARPGRFRKAIGPDPFLGHRQIELVLSDDPEFGPETVAPMLPPHAGNWKPGGGVVALCSPVYQQEDYVRLRDAGLDWVVEWQETYHQPISTLAFSWLPKAELRVPAWTFGTVSSPQALPRLAWACCWAFTISATTLWR